jgi:nicotinamide-nucleotide amidase
MKAEIISIGDELISGKTTNSNAAWMGQEMLLIGVPVVQVTTVGDDAEMIMAALRLAESRADVILLTGGLGPTHDDITRDVMCRYFECELVFNEVVMEHIRTMFRHRGVPLARSNESQAMVPAKAEVVFNLRGTAPGYHFNRSGRDVYVMPGVPHEMKGMMTDAILPALRALNRGLFIAARIFCTTGIAESILFEKIGDADAVERFAKMAFLPSPGGVQIRLIAHGTAEVEAQQRLEQAAAIIYENVGRYIYAEGETTLEEAVARLLVERSVTVATAESCTGGLIAHKLTGIPGSSAFFERGVVCYSNRSKIELLSVAPGCLEAHGAVSAETAMAMAEGVRRLAGTDYGLSTTGIAGPSGGSAEKPVGLVFIGYADAQTTAFERHVFTGERWLNKERFSNSALNFLRKKMS